MIATISDLRTEHTFAGGCPRCGTAFDGDAPAGVRACARCGGVFVGHDVARDLLSVGNSVVEAFAARLASAARPSVLPALGGERRCPDCAALLVQADVFGGALEVDTCNQHGTWFDAGEVRRLRDAVRFRSGSDAATGPELATPATRPPAREYLSTAKRSARLGAHILDLLFIVSPMALGFFLMNVSPELGLGVAFLGFLVAGWFQVTWTLDGQSFGKRRLGIQVLQTNGERASAAQIILLRNLVPNWLAPAGLSGLAYLSRPGGGATWPASYLVVQEFGLTAASYALAGGVLLIFLPAKRALHDYLAGTIVVECGPHGPRH